MPTVYNNSPYFDDFDPTKKFYRILFRPGRAVQARELTQLQTHTMIHYNFAVIQISMSYINTS